MQMKRLVSRVMRAGIWRMVKLRNQVRRRYQASQIRTIFGPHNVACDPDEFVVVCPVYNGGEYIDEFVDHYRSLGAKHLFFLDNGSTDDTLERLQRHDHVSIRQTRLSFKRIEKALRRYLTITLGYGRWALFVDIDELFDYPGADRRSMHELIGYLDAHHYTAVVAQMLDMFHHGSLTEVQRRGIRETYIYFDLSAVTQRPYSAENVISNPQITEQWNGIRYTKFDTTLPLVKHPLVRYAPGIDYVNPHLIRGANVADFSAVLYHYKYTGQFYQRAHDWVSSIQDVGVAKEYRRYCEVIEQQPQFTLYGDTAQRLNNTDDLVDAGFLVVSSQYRAWLRQVDHTSDNF